MQKHYFSNKIREYSQWFLGANNNVADALSRDNDRTDDIYWASFEAMKRKRLNAMPALLKLLELLVIFLLASNANAFTS
jgi:hypothetical protein